MSRHFQILKDQRLKQKDLNMSDRSKAEQVKEKITEYREALFKMKRAASILGMGGMDVAVNNMLNYCTSMEKVTEAHTILETAAKKHKKGKLKEAEEEINKASDILNFIGAAARKDKIIAAVIARRDNLAKEAGVVIKKQVTPTPQKTSSATPAPASAPPAGKEEAAEEIKKLISAANILVTGNKYDEAAKLYGEARKLAAEHDLQDLKDDVDEKAAKIGAIREASGKLKELNDFLDKNIFLSPERLKKEGLELVKVPIKADDDMNSIKSRINEKVQKDSLNTITILKSIISASDNPEIVKGIINDKFERAEKVFPEMLGKTADELRKDEVYQRLRNPVLTSDEDMKTYFISKLEMILSKIKFVVNQ